MNMDINIHIFTLFALPYNNFDWSHTPMLFLSTAIWIQVFFLEVQPHDVLSAQTAGSERE